MKHFIELVNNRYKKEKKSASSFLWFEEKSFTFSEMYTQAYSLHLDLLSFSPEDIVLCCFDRSPIQIISALAIWMAGLVYLPIAKTERPERIQQIIEQSIPKRILTDDPSLFEGISSCEITVPCLPFNKEEICPDSFSFKLEMDRTACLLSTSGTTGKPRLSMLSYRTLSHMAECLNEPLYHWSTTDITLQYSSVSFIVHLREFIGGLCYSKELCMLPLQTITDMDRLTQTIQDRKITRCYMVPSSIQMVYSYIVSTNEFDRLKSIQNFVTGGDRVRPEVVKKIFKIAPNASVGINYGHSETAGHCLYHTVRTIEEIEDAEEIPIGRPRKNISFQTDTEGSLWLRGHGLSHGYLGEWSPKIRVHSFEDIELNTGDIVYQQDELYYFQSRSDNQVKVRGQLVNLDALNRVLANHPFVKEVFSSLYGNDLLVSMIIVDQFHNVSIQILYDLCRELPSYYRPNKILFVEKFIYNPNGKLNIAKTKDLLQQQMGTTYTHLPDLTLNEKELYNTVIEVSQLPSYDILSSFEENGLTSVHRIMLLAHLKNKYPFLSYDSILENNTIQTLSKYLMEPPFADNKVISFDPFSSTDKIGVMFAGSGISIPGLGNTLYKRDKHIRQLYHNVQVFFQDKYGVDLFDIFNNNPKNVSIQLNDSVKETYDNIYKTYGLEFSFEKKEFIQLTHPNGLLFSIHFQQMATLLHSVSTYYYATNIEHLFNHEHAILTGWSLGEYSSILCLYNDLNSSRLIEWLELIFQRGLAVYKVLENEKSNMILLALTSQSRLEPLRTNMKSLFD